MNKSMLKVTAFGIAIIGFYIYITMYVSGLSGTGGGESAGGVTPEAGESVFWGDGQCSTCHKVGSSGSATRGPDQEGLVSRADERAKELGMASGLDYIIESIESQRSMLFMDMIRLCQRFTIRLLCYRVKRF